MQGVAGCLKCKISCSVYPAITQVTSPREKHPEGSLSCRRSAVGVETALTPTGFVWRRLGSPERPSSLTVSGMAPARAAGSAACGLCSVGARHQPQQLPAPLRGCAPAPSARCWKTSRKRRGKSLQQQLQSEQFCFSASEALRLRPAEAFSSTAAVLPGVRGRSYKCAPPYSRQGQRLVLPGWRLLRLEWNQARRDLQDLRSAAPRSRRAMPAPPQAVVGSREEFCQISCR